MVFWILDYNSYEAGKKYLKIPKCFNNTYLLDYNTYIIFKSTALNFKIYIRGEQNEKRIYWEKD